jgi:membrane protein
MSRTSRQRRRDYRPVGASTTGTGLTALVRRTVQEFREDNLTDGAAALTYYGLLSLFPALIAVVSVVGVFGDPVTTTKRVTEIVTNLGPRSAGHTLSGPIESITSNRPGAGLALVLGLAGAIWAASGYIGAFSRAAQKIFETPEGRPIWKLKPLQLMLTIVMVVGAAVIALSLVMTGPIVRAVATPLGIGNTAVLVWNVGKWPVLAVIVILMISLLYYVAPNVKQRSYRWVVPGAAVATVVWLVASILFALYTAHFGSYNKTYGTLAGVVVFLVWLWITNCAVLLGLEVNAERERALELANGVPGADREIQLQPRAEPKPQQTS